jgi:hypothetical protein
MMVIITAKLAKMRWRNVQFFTVNPRGLIRNAGSIAEGGVSFIRRMRATSHPDEKSGMGARGDWAKETVQWSSRNVE